MDELEGIALSEISQRQIPQDLTYMWNLKKGEKTSQKQGRGGLLFSGSPVVKTASQCRGEGSTPGQGV